MSSELRHVSTIRKKNLLNSNTSPTWPDNIVNFGLLMAEICWRVWGTPANFNGCCVLAALLHRTLVVGVSQTTALNRGRHLYSTGRPSRWALTHISSSFSFPSLFHAHGHHYLIQLVCTQPPITGIPRRYWKHTTAMVEKRRGQTWWRRRSSATAQTSAAPWPERPCRCRGRTLPSRSWSCRTRASVGHCRQPAHMHNNYYYYNRFTALFPGPPVWAGARRQLLDFMVQGKINRGRHTDHPAGCHSIQTTGNQCPPPSSHFLQAGCPSCRPTNSIRVLKVNMHRCQTRLGISSVHGTDPNRHSVVVQRCSSSSRHFHQKKMKKRLID